LRKIAVKEVATLFQERKYKGPILMLLFLRMGLAVFYIGFLLNIFFSPIIAFIALVCALITYFLFPKQLHAQYHKIEGHFLKNLNDRAEGEAVKMSRQHANLTPWDGHMTSFTIAKESNLAGKTLREIKIRELMGINIAYINRGDITIQVPNKMERLFPGDEIGVIGTDEQVKIFAEYLRQNEIEIPEKVDTEVVLRQIELNNEQFIGKAIGRSKLRELTQGLVVGIERNGVRMLNPESNIILEKDDILWIVGNKKLLNQTFVER
jgi:CPA2 family monovalent cation:H+ antiporter-2